MSLSCIPLEDDPCDVISKAMRGLGISTSQLAQQTGLNQALIHAALKGQHDDSTLKKIAAALELSATALLGLAAYHPDVTHLLG